MVLGWCRSAFQRCALGLEVVRWRTYLNIIVYQLPYTLLYGRPLARLRRLARRLLAREPRRAAVRLSIADSANRPGRLVMIENKDRSTPPTPRPIVFTHYSNSPYLQFSLGQAKQSNPDATVYLLGDDSNDRYRFVQHHRLADYGQDAVAFARVYRHLSSLPYQFELFAFQRWFILRDFLEAHQLTQCLYLDSDTMLYVDATEDGRRFEHFDFTLSCSRCGSTFFLNRVSALDDFCRFLMDVYTKKDRYHYDKMVSHFAARRRNGLPGGACDMTALQLYSQTHFGQIGEVAQVLDGSVYDPAITTPEPGFEMESGIKKIMWKDGLPYGRHVRAGKEIRFNSLHFQGREAKGLMGRFLTGRSAA